jgi:hypothetical protein
MKTVVETFIIEETQELIYDNEKLDKWNEHIANMGLSGQTKIKAAEKSPIPFLFMNASLVNVFSELVPRKVKVEDYDKTPIPLEILDLIALSKKEQYFERVEIWYNDSNPDPAAIGVKKNPQFDPAYATWDRGFDKYLIGRWADVKMSLDQLTERARKLFVLRRTADYNTQIKNAQRYLEDLQSEAERQFGFAMPETDLLF